MAQFVTGDVKRPAARAFGIQAHTEAQRYRLVHNDSASVNYVRPGERLEAASLLLPRPNTASEHLVAIYSLSIFFGLFYALPIVSCAALFYACFYRSATAALIFALALLDLAVPAGQEWPAFREWKLWDVWRRYFKTCILLPEPPFYDQKMHYMLAQFPHASFPMAAFLTPVLAGDRATGVPGPIGGAIASILLTIPIFKHVFAWSACLPATQSTLLKLLAKMPVGMIPEGVAGIFEGATRDKERLFLKSRKGFVRVAIMAGVDIIPVYHFGNSQMLRYSGSEVLSRQARALYIRQFDLSQKADEAAGWPLLELTKRLRATVGIFWGKYGLAPHPAQLITALGPPVKELKFQVRHAVSQNNNPTNEQVEETHARFVTAIRDLYYQHRHLYGWEERELEIR